MSHQDKSKKYLSALYISFGPHTGMIMLTNDAVKVTFLAGHALSAFLTWFEHFLL